MPATLRLLVGCTLISFCGAAAGPSTTLAHLPNTTVNAVKVDASGNIYVAGFQGTVGTPDSYDAFVAKLSPDGSKVLYSTRFAGSKSASAVALDIDSTGAAYVFGQTQSPDFPVTAGALQTTMLAQYDQGFVAKVDAQGKVVYATLIGGSADIYPSSGGLLVDAAGEAAIRMTLTAPNCPVAGSLPADVERAVRAVPGVTGVTLELTFDPPWSKDRMSEAAKLALGIDDLIPIARLPG